MEFKVKDGAAAAPPGYHAVVRRRRAAQRRHADRLRPLVDARADRPARPAVARHRLRVGRQPERGAHRRRPARGLSGALQAALTARRRAAPRRTLRSRPHRVLRDVDRRLGVKREAGAWLMQQFVSHKACAAPAPVGGLGCLTHIPEVAECHCGPHGPWEGGHRGAVVLRRPMSPDTGLLQWPPRSPRAWCFLSMQPAGTLAAGVCQCIHPRLRAGPSWPACRCSSHRSPPRRRRGAPNRRPRW